MKRKLADALGSKKSKIAMALGAGLVLLALAGVLGTRALSQDEGGRLTISAGIDADCKSQPVELTVPGGKTAHQFKLEKLEPGKACQDGSVPENKGYAFRDQQNRPVYMWSQYQDNPPYERGGPLSSLSLAPGVYTLSVAGGAGAKVELSYQLK